MGPEQLYFIIGFLLGLLITLCLTIAGAIIYYESIEKKEED